MALADFRAPLRASLRAEYGIDLRAPGMWWTDLADLVANFPPGAQFWRVFGGPLAWSDEVHALMAVEYDLRILAWQKTEDGSKGRGQPKPTEPPPLAGQVEKTDERLTRRVEEYQRRVEERRTRS